MNEIVDKARQNGSTELPTMARHHDVTTFVYPCGFRAGMLTSLSEARKWGFTRRSSGWDDETYQYAGRLEARSDYPRLMSIPGMRRDTITSPRSIAKGLASAEKKCRVDDVKNAVSFLLNGSKYVAENARHDGLPHRRATRPANRSPARTCPPRGRTPPRTSSPRRARRPRQSSA